MRLLNVHSLEFADYYFNPSAIPKYVIASHRWSTGAEATLEDIQGQRNTLKSGYRKVLDFVRYVKTNIPGIDWIWIDTCCIDSRNSQEVSTAINSMFRWYAKAEVCLAYLPDVNTTDLGEFRHSEWWTRGWTLQELLAPPTVMFLTKDWHVIGHKGNRKVCDDGSLVELGPPLEAFIASFTNLPANVLRDYEESSILRPEEKLDWAAGRRTSREEDMSYCLIGLLDVAMVANYGEGGDKARKRLLREVSETAHEMGTAMDISVMSSTSTGHNAFGGARTGNGNASDIHETLLASLYFPQLEYRREQINTTHIGTYRWALLSTPTTETKWDNFVAWLRDPQPVSRFYWVNAKPGAGKSSLMRFLEENLKQEQHMQPWSQNLPVVVLSYYFWNPGNDLQKTLVGLLRTMVYQPLKEYPDILMSCLPPHRKNSVRSDAAANMSWDKLELRQYLRASLSAISYSTRILFLIDGLDEVEGGDDELDDLLEFLGELARYSNVKLCVSSRRWTVFQDAFNACPRLLLEDLNAEDIALYVRDRLQSHNRFQGMLTYDMRAEELIHEIITKARGVFLWTRLVVKELLRGVRDGDGLDVLQQKVRAIPGDLDEYFTQILDSIEAPHRSQACAVFQLALQEQSKFGKFTPLRLLDLVFIAHGDTDFALSDRLEYYVNHLKDVDVLAHTLDSALRILSSRCKGLLDCHIIYDSHIPDGLAIGGGETLTNIPGPLIEALHWDKNVVFDLRIDFMHRSVRDYLLSPDRQRFLQHHTRGPFDVQNYLRNARLCQFFMSKSWRMAKVFMIEFASYFICTFSSPQFRDSTRCAQFARRFQPARKFLSKCGEYAYDYWYIYGPLRSWADEQSSYYTLAIDFKWTGYLNETLTAEMIQGKRGRPMLDYVLRTRILELGDPPNFLPKHHDPSPELVQKVLSLGADPNEIYDDIPLWPHFLSFVAENGRGSLDEMSTSAYISSLEAMIRGGANLHTNVRELSGPSFGGAGDGNPLDIMDIRWPQLASKMNLSAIDSEDKIAVIDVIECLRSVLGDAVDGLKKLIEQRSASRTNMSEINHN